MSARNKPETLQGTELNEQHLACMRRPMNTNPRGAPPHYHIASKRPGQAARGRNPAGRSVKRGGRDPATAPVWDARGDQTGQAARRVAPYSGAR